VAKLPETGPSLRRIIEQQKRQANRAQNSSPFTRSGGGVTAPDTFTFSGSLIIEGDLSVPTGKIKNDWLESPIAYGSDKAFSAGGATTTVSTLVATASVVVPAGYTKALVTAYSDANAVNVTGSADYLYVETTIDAYAGGENYAYVANATADGVSHTATTELTGLVGGDFINCGVYTRTGFAAWAADSANLWRVQAAVIFSR
jgi:hypothetical protein